MISDDQKEEVKARADIVEIIGESVALRRSGRSFMGRCPFHDDATPSFSVTPDRQGYRCFGCGASGDVFTFLQEHRGMEFLDAVRYLAARTGVHLREVREEEEEDPEERFLADVNAFAQSWFQAQLEDPETGREARDYLDGRGIDAETRERFGLGWAPDEWRAFRDAAGAHGIDDADLLRMGLLTRSVRNPTGEPYDAFRRRVIFPIRDRRGRTIAFGGRVLGDGHPKYINTAETPVYTKGEHLYGFDRSRNEIRREGEALLVEGYMDLVSLAAAGFPNVVASLGTALTPEQAALLASRTQRVLILYDSDSAGLKATFRVADVLLGSRIQPFAVTLPEGEDPDTLVRREGAAALRRALGDALDIVDLKLKILDDRGRLSTSAGKRDALDRLLPTLRATVDESLRDIYIGEVAERLAMRRETIEEELARAAPTRVFPGAAPAGFGAGGGAVSPGGSLRAGGQQAVRRSLAAPTPHGAGWRILRILACDRERRHEHLTTILESIGPEDFKNEAERFIFQTFVDDPDLAAPPPEAPPEVARLLEELLAEVTDPEELTSAGRVLHASVDRLAEDRLHDEMDRIQEAIEATDDVDEKRRLLGEKTRLREEASALAVRWAPALRKHARGLNEPSR